MTVKSTTKAAARNGRAKPDGERLTKADELEVYRDLAATRGAEVARAKAREAALRWWGWAVATLEHLGSAAAALSREANRDGSPLAGMFDLTDLDLFAGRMGEWASNLANNSPALEGIPDPLDGITA